MYVLLRRCGLFSWFGWSWGFCVGALGVRGGAVFFFACFYLVVVFHLGAPPSPAPPPPAPTPPPAGAPRRPVWAAAPPRADPAGDGGAVSPGVDAVATAGDDNQRVIPPGELSAFHAETGVPMLLNTSFNRRGEPIVETPEDAVTAFLELGLDGLWMDGVFLYRPP